MKQKLLGLVISIVISVNDAVAQDDTGSEWLAGVMLLGGRSSVIDKNFSAIPYTGMVWGGGARGVYLHKNISHGLEAGFATGTPQVKNNKDYSMNQLYCNLDYTLLYESGHQDGSFTFKAGGSLDLLYIRRNYDHFVNRKSTYEFVSSAGAAAEITWFLGNGPAAPRISNRLILPLVSSVIQPGFGNEKGKDFRNMQVLTLPQFLRFRNLLAFTIDMNNSHQLSLEYTWDYYQVKKIVDISQAGHFIGFTYMFGL